MEQLILECVVRSLSIAVCTAAVLFVLRVKAARVRHAVWASVVGLMLILPVWTAWGPKAVLRVLKPEPAIVYTQALEAQQTVSGPQGPTLPVRSELWTWQNAMIAAYLLGFCALMARLLTGTFRVRKLTSERCVAPITLGWLRPTVILPPDSDQWSPEQLNAVLIHEDEHARHRDPMVQWVALLNRAIFWFHPLAWWLERRLSALAEEACDDAVLKQGQDPVQYSEYLLDLARAVQQAGGMAMARTFLPQRIKRIALGEKPQQIGRSQKTCLAVAIAAISFAFTAGAVAPIPRIAFLPPDAYVGPAQVAPAPTPATQAEPAPASIAVPSLPWKPSWQGQGAQVIVGTINGEMLSAQVISPAKPTDGFGVGFQTLSGTVADPSGAVVPNAPVTLNNTDTNEALRTTTNMTGRFQFTNIQPGNYDVQIKTQGFKTTVQNNIHVSAGEAHNAGNILLQVGSIFESISVTGSRSAAASTPQPAAQPDPFIKTLGPMTVLRQSPNPAPAPIKQQPAARPGDPIRVGGNIQASHIISQTKPVYPQDALQQSIGGTVKFEAVVTKEGTLSEIKLINSPDPRLTQAALDAMKNWRYEPTLLNGEPIEVITTIDVNYEPGN